MRLSEVRQRIAALTRVDLKRVEVDDLRLRIRDLFRPYEVSTPLFDKQQKFYRGVNLGFKPQTISEITYPPAHLVTKFQRANRPSQPMFYCSASREAPFFELKCSAGCYVTISRWNIVEMFYVQSIGYSQHLLTAKGSNRKALPDWAIDRISTVSPASRLINEFLSKEFSKDVLVGKEDDYKLSVAIVESLMGTFKNSSAIESRLPPKGEFGGVIYPALAMSGNSDNLALAPDTVDRCLRPEYVEYIRVKEKTAALKYEIELLDFADSFAESGEIQWKGRRPHWVISNNDVHTVALEKGKWVMRNSEGVSLPMT